MCGLLNDSVSNYDYTVWYDNIFFWGGGLIMNHKICGRKQFEHNLSRGAMEDQKGPATVTGLVGRHLNSKPREYQA